MADVLTIRDLRIEFRRGGLPRRPPVIAVDGLTLTIGEGEIVGLVGESGSGKSTTGLAALEELNPTARAASSTSLVSRRTQSTRTRLGRQENA